MTNPIHNTSALQQAIAYALRPYQREAKADIYKAWDLGFVNVLAVLPTGAGKTVTFSDILNDHVGAACAIAHRSELVTQISLALARDGVRHRVIGSKATVKLCNDLHMQELGVSYVYQDAQVAVASVDTLNGSKELDYWRMTVTLWVMDEAHHVVEGNKWGKAAALFPNARGLGVTATPLRADRKGLGRHADGVFDYMVVGPSMRDLINMGYLTDYRIFGPPSDLTMAGEKAGKSGDWSPAQLKKAAKKSKIVGDVVEHYLRIAKGKLGITFSTDVETATAQAAQFNAAGVPAAVVHGKTPDKERIAILAKLRRRELLMLVNVDLFGEGFDLPAIEVVIMARPTESYGLFVQQFGRALRLMLERALICHWDSFTDAERRAHIAASGKPYAIIIDHVGNIERFAARPGLGLPDAPKTWTLDRGETRPRGQAADVIPVRACPECTAIYRRILSACPHCGHAPQPAARSGPEYVDGDLTELDPQVLVKLRGEADRLVAPVRYPVGMPAHARAALHKRHGERKEAQEELREAIAWWAGHQRAKGRDDRESYRRFYFKFGMDVLSAQALGAKDARELAARVNKELGRWRIDTISAAQ